MVTGGRRIRRRRRHLLSSTTNPALFLLPFPCASSLSHTNCFYYYYYYFFLDLLQSLATRRNCEICSVPILIDLKKQKRCSYSSTRELLLHQHFTLGNKRSPTPTQNKSSNLARHTTCHQNASYIFYAPIARSNCLSNRKSTSTNFLNEDWPSFRQRQHR